MQLWSTDSDFRLLKTHNKIAPVGRTANVTELLQKAAKVAPASARR